MRVTSMVRSSRFKVPDQVRLRAVSSFVGGRVRGRRFLSICTVIVTVLLLAGCGSTGTAGPRVPQTRKLDHLTLWLDYTPWGAHVPIFVAQSKGYFRREGLAVSIRVPASVTDPLKLVADSQSALGIGYMSDVVTAEAAGIPVESIGALVQHHLNCIMTLARSGITSPRQLAGKTVGAAETPADNVILDTVFEHAGVMGQVRRVNINYDYVPALLSGRVSAIEGGYQVWERIEIEQAGQKVNVIQLQNWGVPDEYELVLLAGSTMVRRNPDTVRRFMRAIGMGESFAVKHPNQAVKVFLNSNPAYKTTKGKALVSRSWHLLIPFVQPPGVRFATQSPARWGGLAQWMYHNHLVSKLVPNGRLFTDRFVP